MVVDADNSMSSRRKRGRLDEANLKLGEAIAKTQNSLTRECRNILDPNIGVSPRACELTDGELWCTYNNLFHH